MNRRHRVIGIGEIIWDVLPEGKRLGGAPANFAFHSNSFGMDAAIISRIGSDEDGAEMMKKITQLEVDVSGVSIDLEHHTGRVLVNLNEEGIPSYKIEENVAWDYIEISAAQEALLRETDAICFGTLGQRSRISAASIAQAMQLVPSSCLKVFDINLREKYFTQECIELSLQEANVCKLNSDELPVVAGILDLKGSNPLEQLHNLRRLFDLDTIIYTRGAAGSILISRDQVAIHEGISTQVRDSVGAGDAFAAVVVTGLLKCWSLERISQLANEVAAYVCSQDGATPALSSLLSEKFMQDRDKDIQKNVKSHAISSKVK